MALIACSKSQIPKPQKQYTISEFKWMMGDNPTASFANITLEAIPRSSAFRSRGVADFSN